MGMPSSFDVVALSRALSFHPHESNQRLRGEGPAARVDAIVFSQAHRHCPKEM